MQHGLGSHLDRRKKRPTDLPDVVELPVEDSHGVGVWVCLDAAPICCRSLIAA